MVAKILFHLGVARTRLLVLPPLSLLVLLASGPAPVRAQEALPSLEEELSFLQAEETVESASRYVQKVEEAAAAVTVIGAEHLRRYGYQNLDDAMQSLVGFSVTNDRNYSYLGVRGFGLPADYNSRVLLQLDGHRMNEPIYGTAFMGWESGIDLGDVERLEAVRGPASALYGTNAMFGTVSLASRRPSESPTRELSLLLGDPGLVRLAARARGTAGGAGYALTVHGLQREGHETLFYPEMAGIDDNEDGLPDFTGYARNQDEERALGFRGQFSLGDLALTAFYSNRSKEVPTGSFGTIFDPRGKAEESLDERAFLDLSYQGQAGPSFSWKARASLDSYHYEGWYPYAYEFDYSREDYASPPYTVSRDDQDAQWVGLALSGDFSGLPRQRLVFGGNLRYNWVTLQYYDEDPAATYLDEDYSYHEGDVYLQDEVRVAPWALLLLGVNYSTYDADVFQGDVERANPRVGLVLSLGEATTVKALYGEAFRVPNLFEMYYNDGGVTQITNPELGPEVMRTAELVVERRLPLALRLRLSGYYNRIRDLIAAEEVEEGVIQFRNSEDEVVSKGLELELRRPTGTGVSGYASVSVQRTENDETGERLPNSPTVTAQGGFSLPLGQSASLSLEGRYVGPRRTVDLEDEVDDYAVANLTVATTALAPGLQLSASAFNLFDEEYSDPGSFDHLQAEIPQDGRTLRVQATYRF